MLTKDTVKPMRRLAGGVLLALVLLAGAYFVFFQGLSSGGRQEDTSPQIRSAEAATSSYWDDRWLLARVIMGEAGDEPYTGKVAVGAVMLNRVRSNSFPKTISGVIFEPDAFESVSNGLIWQREPSWEATRAAESALSGWDPSYGALFFWNPSKPVSAWIWTRQIITQIGNHVFAR